MKGKNKGWTWPERWFVIKSFLLLHIASRCVRQFGYLKVYKWIQNKTKNPSPPGDFPAGELHNAIHTGLLVNIANRRFPTWQVDCLPESLTVWGLLRRQGMDARLRLGVREQDGRLDGHAWVEYAGQVVSGDPGQPTEYLTLN
jgi:hypothetical protein